eukprot:gene5692-8689_t
MNTDGPLGAPYELEGSIQVPVDMHRHEDTLGSMPQDDKSRLWPGGKVRYVIGTTYTDSILPADHFLAEDDEDIKWAVEHVSSKTCIEFTKCQVDECEPPFVLFVSSSHCSSGWGRDGAVNLISVSSDCGRTTIAGFSVNSYDSAQFYPIPNPIPRYVASWVSNIDYSSRDTLEQFVGEDSFAEVKGTLQSSHNGYVKVYVAGDYTFYVTTVGTTDSVRLAFDNEQVITISNNVLWGTRHTGYLAVDVAGDHTFYLSPSNAVQMYLDGEMIIDDGVGDGDYDSRTPAQDWIGVIDFDTNGWSLLGYGDGHFTSRHTGYLTVTVTGDHTFYLTSNDGSRMFLD